MQLIGRTWQSMEEKDRNYYQDKADCDKIRYIKEMRAYYDEVERIGKLKGT